MDVSTTPHINVQVCTKYLLEQSTPDSKQYIFSYTITIKNSSREEVQLIGRKWLITDANGKQLTIEGDGIVGQQPFISPNERYTYTSLTALETPVGAMQGHYRLLDSSRQEFKADIAPFSLSVPNILH